MLWHEAVAQTIDIWLNVVALSNEPVSLEMLAYDAVRYVVPGVGWAWLYWQYGFSTAEVASVGCHAFLEPALGYLLS